MAELATNAFYVYSSQHAGQENHLTRALLVLLRLSPLAHSVWLRRIGLGDRGLVGLGSQSYAFQTGAVPAIDSGVQGSPVRGISVFISREPAYSTGPIEDTTDRMIPDAIVTYPEGEEPVVVVVESKVRTMADATQAREVNLGGVPVTWNPGEPVLMRWAELIDDLWALLDLDLVSATERRLLLDFFDFVDGYYREVGPYSTIRRCGGIRERLRRRCRALIAEATGLEAFEPSRGNGPYVKIPPSTNVARRVFFDTQEDGSGLVMSLWPADIPSQAPALYASNETIDRLRTLASQPGWGLQANMHFGHFQAGYAWMAVPAPVDAYMEFWRTHQDRIRMVYRPPRDHSWDELLDLLESNGIIGDRTSFEKDFIKTGRNQADVRPGLMLYRVWDLEEATHLDDEQELVGDVRAAYEQALKAFMG